MLEGFHSWFWDSLIFRSRLEKELNQAIVKANQLLSQFNAELVGKGFLPVSEISQIDRRRLEICRALATKPALLLLDEPSAGMSPEESAELMLDLRRIREKEYRQLSIILVEHDMTVIEDITDRVIALNYGKKIAEGTFEAVSRNEELREAYLGR
jgi:ABC-type branched-subunit amino acid transport system ATPase component